MSANQEQNNNQGNQQAATPTGSETGLEALSGGAERPAVKVPTLRAADLDFSPEHSTAVVSSAQKFVIPVPQFAGGGEALVIPEGEKKGQVVTNYKGEPIEGRGIVFYNLKDNAWQAAPGNGNAVVLINLVSAEQSLKLMGKIEEYANNPNDLTVEQLKDVLQYAEKDLGFDDIYTSTRDFVKAKMTPAIAGEVPTDKGAEIECYGLKKRDDRDVWAAVYIPVAFDFEGPAATAQRFANGGVVLKSGNSIHGIQSETFMETYRLKSGERITSLVAQIANHLPEEGGSVH